MNRESAGERVSVVVGDSIVEIMVGSGRRRNALRAADWDLLTGHFDAVSRLPAVRAVVVRGAEDTFCAGSDITEWIDAEPRAVDDSFERMEQAFRAVERCPVPVIAQVQGVAAGAGCQLALACDLRVMADSARIGMPIARLGILPSPAFAARLVHLAGPALARELLYTGRLLSAREAAAAGLANAVVPDADVTEHVAGLLARIADQPAVAVRAAKRAVTEATGELPQRSLGPAASYGDLQSGITRLIG
ncbi:enoyl-CoA hydratase/isomerase family protein [Microtetraspora malaysiensis]|uniref:enoyl-CoA hydratase/isomerase family protein n=1 Tax=Microtetraspora malaysiensis TaxID=161358 RepID=UPI003D8D0E94